MTFLQLCHPSRDQLSDLVDLDRRCLGGIWSLEGYQREWESSNSELLILASGESRFQKPQIRGCGCFWAILEEAHITLLMIEPNFQGRGWGGYLLSALLKAAVRRGLERATLEVRVSNQIAIALYQKFGFIVLGRRKRYYVQTGEDALILWRNDLQHPIFQERLAIWHENYGDRLQIEEVSQTRSFSSIDSNGA